MLDFVGARIEPTPPARLDQVSVRPDGDDATRWQVESTQGHFAIHDARLFVHEDLRGWQVAIPPRPGAARQARSAVRVARHALRTPLARAARVPLHLEVADEFRALPAGLRRRRRPRVADRA
ncbi:MAG: hypothetical protein U1F18_08350 [Steroidobacteraceae bacterium]